MVRTAVYRRTVLSLAISLISLTALAQQVAAPSGGAVVPLLVNYTGIVAGANGKPHTGTAGITFALYALAGDTKCRTG